MGDDGEVIKAGNNLVDGDSTLEAEDMCKQACGPVENTDRRGSWVVESKKQRRGSRVEGKTREDFAWLYYLLRSMPKDDLTGR